jgi:hypothetical protein
VLHLKKPDRSRPDDRKLEHVRPYLERTEREGRYGVVAIVARQEFEWVPIGTQPIQDAKRRSPDEVEFKTGPELGVER